MHHRTSVILMLLVALAGCFAKQAARKDPPADETIPAIQELTPPSPLALMMRAMATHADSCKAAIAKNQGLPPFPKEFKGIMKAQPTVGMHIDPITFPTFARDYQVKLDRLYKVRSHARTGAYNALVQSCANCHGSHCPGPLMRIKKMYATEGTGQ